MKLIKLKNSFYRDNDKKFSFAHNPNKSKKESNDKIIITTEKNASKVLKKSSFKSIDKSVVAKNSRILSNNNKSTNLKENNQNIKIQENNLNIDHNIDGILS